jgi:hypothetical protein
VDAAHQRETASRSVTAAISFTSAPATKVPGLPLISTTPRSCGSLSSTATARSRSAIAASPITFTLRAGSSITRCATPFTCRSTRKTLIRHAPG